MKNENRGTSLKNSKKKNTFWRATAEHNTKQRAFSRHGVLWEYRLHAHEASLAPYIALLYMGYDTTVPKRASQSNLDT